MAFIIQLLFLCFSSAIATYTIDCEITPLDLVNVDNAFLQLNYDSDSPSVTIMQELKNDFLVDYEITNIDGRPMGNSSGVSFCSAKNSTQNGSMVNIMKTYLGVGNTCPVATVRIF